MPDNEQWAASSFQDPPRTEGGVALCGACRLLGHCRLGVVAEHLDDDGVAWLDVSCPRDQEGGPNVAHGGWTAATMDECLGHLPLLNKTMCVTAELTVKFLKPVPVDLPLQVKVWVERREGSRWYLAGEMVLKSSGAVLASASGVWVTRDPSHYDRHRQWLSEQDQDIVK
jgi:acyl-coenzyme A thioesterase PaaI-like protein